ncbi:MAG: histidine triad nucleotide-binding protein [Dehalococcoides mccartyi]|jgi:Diadenosine tetraphosphate (Ap4A) hydrolase and other HIT family hydrolases|uniref:Histidine triad nucleotide-binding protein n=2 Tax=root TaxID=1 RepID=A0AB33HPF1_9CHLR|nr:MULTISPECIES: histidine triad nucleotide-binding protein [Dehalococcoides]AQU02840.1 histidine triad nucleotide-binding protein [Dehalococcoides mccartyi]AQU04168.1 histidine triad nucleotide-binding protein [Dehalococcoides mccartyi]MBF4482612.1 histidine triad nucleotide-binding protein [Dehalococcoides mccartyi]MBJ7532389.1 histidine triad nucleotide-binding protein [Dehalococcoides mccartyi]MDP4279834.1 histidine triad nucleotide-binding protein [Dehalococcoides mccartyi]
MSCIFCQIVKGEIPAQIVYRDEDLVAFKDINPQSPVHILIIPRRHIANLTELDEADTELAGKMILLAGKLAREMDIAESGYRLVINSGREGGQVVNHLHLHLLGGRQLGGQLG